MGEDDLELGEVGRHIVDVDRVRVLEPDAAAPGKTRADPAVAGVKEGGQPSLGDHLVEGVGSPVVGEERLQVRVELEAAAGRAGSTLANGIRTSAYSAAPSSTSSLGTGGRPDCDSQSTVKTTAAIPRSR